MTPQEHFLYGLLCCLIFYLIFPMLPLYGLALILIGSLLIDIDHYIIAVIKTRNFSIAQAIRWHIQEGNHRIKRYRQGIYEKEPFHFLHTIEMQGIFLFIGIFYAPFLYVFIGMFIHTLLDMYHIWSLRVTGIREYFFSKWLFNYIRNNKCNSIIK